MVLGKVMIRPLALVLAAAAGAGAVVIAEGAPMRPALFEGGFRWTPSSSGADGEHEARVVTPAQILHLPQLLGDFDLLATVELPDHGELDLVFRMVEPRLDGGDIEPFHARFTLLRLSAETEGPPYRTREEALFSDDMSGGVRLRAGQPASIRVEARGERLRANVAGRWLPWVETTDDHGAIAFVARGGASRVSYLVVEPRTRPAETASWLWGGLIAAVGAAIAIARGAAALSVLVSWVLILPLGGWLAHQLVFAHVLPWVVPTPTGALLGGLWMLPLALSSARRRWVGVIGAAVLGVVMLEAAARVERPRLTPFEDQRLTLHFGPESGPAPFHALSQRLRSRTRVHTLDEPARRVVFLGGGSIFEASPDFSDHVGLRVEAGLRQRFGRDVSAIIFATPLSNALQQLLLFRRFYLGFDPDVVVFGLTGMESVAGQKQRARALLELTEAPASAGAPIVLWELADRLVGGDQPVATPADVAQTLADLGQLCRDREIPLVLVTEPSVDPAMIDVARRFSEEFDVPLLLDVVDQSGAARVDELLKVVGDRL